MLNVKHESCKIYSTYLIKILSNTVCSIIFMLYPVIFLDIHLRTLSVSSDSNLCCKQLDSHYVTDGNIYTIRI